MVRLTTMGRLLRVTSVVFVLGVGSCGPVPTMTASPVSPTPSVSPIDAPIIGHRSSKAATARGGTKSSVRSGKGKSPGPPPKTAGAGCAPTKVCNGSSTPELVAAFQNRAMGTRHCYERELRHTPKVAQGRISVQVQLDATGHVCQATIVEGREWASRALSTCVTKIMAGNAYPAPLDDCVDVVVPLRFVADHAGTPDIRVW